jgi:hypothetical protein
MPEKQRWRLLVDAAKRGAVEAGYSLSRVPGRGLSNIWNVEKSGKAQKAAIRTSRDRSVAFHPLAGGTKWKTLDDVEVVIVAVVDAKDSPQNIEVYIFPASEVRERFDASYAARTKAGQVHKDNFGMWVAIDHDTRGIASSVGSGIVGKFKPVAVYSITSLIAANAELKGVPVDEEVEIDETEPQEARPTTIAEVMAWARERVAEIAGVRIEAVKLDLKVEY